MSENAEELKHSNKEDESERYFDYYMKKDTMIITIFLSLYLLLDIIAVFLSYNYDFTQLVLYFGVFLAIFAAASLYFVWRKKDYFWSIVAAVILGLIPFIEVIVYIARHLSMDIISLALAIVAGVIFLALMILPEFLVYYKYYKEHKAEETTN
jgi:hypothetical protein